jgi:hypothetical protein
LIVFGDDACILWSAFANLNELLIHEWMEAPGLCSGSAR